MNQEKVGLQSLTPEDKELINRIKELAKIEQTIQGTTSYQELYKLTHSLLNKLNGREEDIVMMLGAQLLAFQFNQSLLAKADPETTEALMKKRGKQMVAKIRELKEVAV